MRILDRSVYVGPSLYARFPVIRLELDLGRTRSVAHRQVGAAVRGCARRGAARTGRTRLLLPGARRILPAHARGRRYLAGARARARRDRAAEHCRRGSDFRQDPQRRRPGRLHGDLRICAARRGHCRRRTGPAAAVFAVARVNAPGGQRARRVGAGRRRATSSSASRSAAHSGPRRPHWYARRSSATSPGCA